jgi:hypothetical protein
LAEPTIKAFAAARVLVFFLFINFVVECHPWPARDGVAVVIAAVWLFWLIAIVIELSHH